MSNIIEVQLGGGLRTLRFNNWQKEALGNILGKDPLIAGKILAKKAKESPLDALCDLVYTSLIGDYRVQRKNLDFTPATVAEWLGEADINELGAVFTAWLDSSGLRKLIPTQPEENPKPGEKKPRKKKVHGRA